MEQKQYCLVYQGGLANVFEVDCLNLKASGRTTRRLMQTDFGTCQTFARGLAEGGHIVYSMHCNSVGDISNCDWDEDLSSAPFHHVMRPVFQKKVIP